MGIKIISAGAGSGKTYRLTREMVDFLTREGVRPEGIMATTFTRKAAAELQERCRRSLLEKGLTEKADALGHALIGTVHSIGVKLLQRFAYEAGVSPAVDIIADEDQQVFFNQALAIALSGEHVERMEALALRFNHDQGYGDWRDQVRKLSELARANAFDPDRLARSAARSWESLADFLDPERADTPRQWLEKLSTRLEEAIVRLEENEDTTKKTSEVLDNIKAARRDLDIHGHLPWSEWARLGKLSPGVKSREDVRPLTDFAQTHTANPAFRADIRSYIDTLFELAAEAIRQYDDYKRRRGLIDYTDMEVLVNKLLDNEEVRAVLRSELDLLLVDEFQDTSPLQLELFLKLSRLATHSVWVGDPKQSIYGFRGAEPELMQAVIHRLGGVRPEDILGFSWRSAREIVHTANAIFTRAFDDMPPAQVALEIPKERRILRESQDAIQNWRLRYNGRGSAPGTPWTERVLARILRQELEAGTYEIVPKGAGKARPLRAGDVAILCRSNRSCQTMAEALAAEGLKAALSRSGLLQTAEAKLVLACMRYLLSARDTLAVAEILVLGQGWTTEVMAEHRLDHLSRETSAPWAADQPFLQRLDALRSPGAELSSSELLDLLLEKLDLRRICVAWGNPAHRLNNLERLRQMAREYEEACARLHEAASMGGFLLWLEKLADAEEDKRSSSEAADAVNILTYHAAKGLEWPLVVCYNLDNKLRLSPWGISIVGEQAEVNLDDVLGGRWLRLWVNPYGRQDKNTPLYDRIAESEVFAHIEAAERAEEKRLLYVGLTRARDYLVFANGPRGTAWLNRVYWNESKQALLPEKEEESPFRWNGRTIPMVSTTHACERELPEPVPPGGETITYWEARAGSQPHPPYFIDPKADAPPLNLAYAKWQRYGRPLPPLDHHSPAEATEMLQAILAMDPAERDARALEGSVHDHLARFLPHEAWKAARVADNVSALYRRLQELFPTRRTYRHYPLTGRFGDRRFETVADMLLEGPEGLVLVQHSGQQGKEADLRRHTQRILPRLYFLEKTAEQAFQKRVQIRLLHFALEGVLLEYAPEKGN